MGGSFADRRTGWPVAVAVGTCGQDSFVWLVMDPDHPRRRVVFGDEQSARRHAAGLTPAWTVLPAENPQVVAITGIWPVDVDQR